MGSNMKTTIDIADTLLEQAKTIANKKKLTLKQVIEFSLRQFLQNERKSGGKFSLPEKSFGEGGYQAGIDEGNWDAYRSIIYQGRGE